VEKTYPNNVALLRLRGKAVENPSSKLPAQPELLVCVLYAPISLTILRRRCFDLPA
jgi:hypothetical protein